MISKSQIKVFLVSFIAVFAMVALPNLGIKMPKFEFLQNGNLMQIISPLPKDFDIFDSLKPKLEQKPNTFELKKPSSLVPQVYAGLDFDQATAYGVIDLDTGEVLASKNLDQKLPIASLTKLMSAVVALDLATPNQLFTAGDQGTKMIPTKIVVKNGEKLTLEELLTASLLTSANDAIQVVADNIDQTYNQAVFVRAMNEKARALKLTNSHFTNPQGFDDGHPYSSVADLATLSGYALKNYPLISGIVAKEQAEFPQSNLHQYFYLNNWNGLMGVYPGVKGIKIGNTDDAGKTTMVVSGRQGKTLLAVVLGAPGLIERDLWTAQLLDLGFQKSLNLDPVNVTQEQLKAKYKTWKYFNESCNCWATN